ncbi:Hint domain-containing protein [Celeribacter sp.]|uniref:Hint domain-containing protein n=1 Tax=Celeribacter sp. TaxID=1890673 RepID=UPI003A8D2E52
MPENDFTVSSDAMYQISGDMIGTYSSASLNGTNKPNHELTVSGVETLGDKDDEFYLKVTQFNSSDEYMNNGQRWTIYNADEEVVASGLIPNNNDYQGLGAGNEHLLFQQSGSTGYIIDLGGLTDGTMHYTAADDVANGNGPNGNKAELGIEDVANAVVCFAAGTMMRTASGLRAVEDLSPGDLVWTADHGMQPVRWVGKSRVDLTRAPDLAPIEIQKGALGADAPSQPVCVSPQHRVLVTGHAVELYAGLEEALVPAHRLVNGGNIRQKTEMTEVTYVHVMFNRHELLDSCGLVSESFYPGATAVSMLEQATRDELFRIFPQLRLFGDEARPRLARAEIRGREAALFSNAA